MVPSGRLWVDRDLVIAWLRFHVYCRSRDNASICRRRPWDVSESYKKLVSGPFSFDMFFFSCPWWILAMQIVLVLFAQVLRYLSLRLIFDVSLWDMIACVPVLLMYISMRHLIYLHWWMIVISLRPINDAFSISFLDAYLENSTCVHWTGTTKSLLLYVYQLWCKFTVFHNFLNDCLHILHRIHMGCTLLRNVIEKPHTAGSHSR